MKLAERLTAANPGRTNGIAASPSSSSSNGHHDANGGQGEGEKGPLLKSVRFGPVLESEARSAVEMMLLGSGSQVKPVIEWDGKAVGTGTVQYSTVHIAVSVLYCDVLRGVNYL